MLLLLVTKSRGSALLTSRVLATEYLPNSKICGNYWIKESYWGFMCLLSPVQIYTHLPGLFAFSRNNWSRTSPNNRLLVLVFSCMYSPYLGMFKLRSLLIRNLIGVQRYCPRNCQGSTPIELWWPCNIKARCSWPMGLCVKEGVRWCYQAALRSFLSLILQKEVENFYVVLYEGQQEHVF